RCPCRCRATGGAARADRGRRRRRRGRHRAARPARPPDLFRQQHAGAAPRADHQLQAAAPCGVRTMMSGTPLITPPTISHRIGSASLLTIAGALLLAISALSLITFFSQRQVLLDETRVEARILADNVAAALLFDDRVAALET